MIQQSCFVLGYTGEVGKVLTQLLLDTKKYKVVLIGRRQVDKPELAQCEQRIIDFEKIEQYSDAFKDCSVGFCCLGTTRGKAGKEGFYKVDHDYIVNSAKMAKDAGCEQFHLVSTMGANSNAMMYYSQVKGVTENDIKSIGFDRLYVYRPGMILCDREERRIGEKVAHFALSPIFYVCPTWISSPVVNIAKAMVINAAPSIDKTEQTCENGKIHELAKAYDSEYKK